MGLRRGSRNRYWYWLRGLLFFFCNVELAKPLYATNTDTIGFRTTKSKTEVIAMRPIYEVREPNSSPHID
jgi:hypothetical protein